MKINRVWAMPNKWTFQIKPIAELLERYNVGAGWADPCAGISLLAEHRNDLNPKNPQSRHKFADQWLLKFKKDSLNGVVFDPPYSLEQTKRAYESAGVPFTYKDTHNAVRWTIERNIIKEIVKPDGLCISFGYSSTCMGKKRGFKIIEILLVAHGSGHYDTIVTVEQKLTAERSRDE